MSEEEVTKVLMGIAEAGGVTGMLALLLVAILLLLRRRRQRLSFSCSSCASEISPERRTCTQAASRPPVEETTPDV